MLELKFAEFPQRKEVHGLFMYPPQTQHADFLCAAAAAARIRRCKRFSRGKCLSHKIFKKKKKKKKRWRIKKLPLCSRGKNHRQQMSKNSPARPEHH